MQDREAPTTNFVVPRNIRRKRSLLGMFGKRLSRIEPDPRSFEIGVYHSEGELTPIVRRCSNNNNISSCSAGSSKTINGFSNNLTFCCSYGAAKALSPIESCDVPIIRPNLRPRTHLKLELETLENWNVLEVERRLSAVVPSGSFNCKLFESKYSNSQKIRLQKPIMESKSRFRNRYLPPLQQEYQLTGMKQRYQYYETYPGGKMLLQHSSTPDIIRALAEEEQKIKVDRK